jgi:hypothetical protein
MTNDNSLRAHLRDLLDWDGAHLKFQTVVSGWPVQLRGARPRGYPHTGWQILEHMRIAQWDILEFSRNPAHVSPEFPAGYWPPTPAPPNQGAWSKSVKSFQSDLNAMIDLVSDPATDLFAQIPQGSGQTILREALLVADHNSYHLGQLVDLRRLLGAWKSR